MGWWSDKKDDAKEASKEKTIEALKWPVVKIASGAMSAYYKSKGKVAKGTCPECRNPITKDGYIHRKCAKKAESAVSTWESKHRKDGSSRSGNHFNDCNCNENWRMHECKKYRGEEMNKF